MPPSPGLLFSLVLADPTVAFDGLRPECLPLVPLHQSAYVAVLEDLSALTPDEFWDRMRAAGRVWSFDEKVGSQPGVTVSVSNGGSIQKSNAKGQGKRS